MKFHKRGAPEAAAAVAAEMPLEDPAAAGATVKVRGLKAVAADAERLTELQRSLAATEVLQRDSMPTDEIDAASRCGAQAVSLSVGAQARHAKEVLGLGGQVGGRVGAFSENAGSVFTDPAPNPLQVHSPRASSNRLLSERRRSCVQQQRTTSKPQCSSSSSSSERTDALRGSRCSADSLGRQISLLWLNDGGEAAFGVALSAAT
ncbi:hypothetical protein Esti_004815 [Eimeria stiedai]